MLGGFDDLVQLDDVGMPDQLQDVDFPRDTLHICHVNYLLFFQDLDGYLLACWDVGGRLDFSEGALSQCLSSDRKEAYQSHSCLSCGSSWGPVLELWPIDFRSLSESFNNYIDS